MADASTYTLLQRITLDSNATSVTFSSIPQTGYTDLKIDFSARTDKSAVNENIYLSFNSSTSNFSARWFYGGGSGGVGSSTTGRIAGFADGNTATSNTFGSSSVYIPNYTSSNYKSYSGDATLETIGSVAYDGFIAGLWSDTSAITSITLTPETGPNFLSGSTFSLYAVSAVGTTPGTPKALGGDTIVSDGTYWYHAFLNTGQFTPASTLSCDVLQVAGGGGGGGAIGAGGGAGGLLTFTSQSFTATSYPVIIGAGGTGGSSVNGYNGNNSQLGSLTTSIGGGRGGTRGQTITGATGGSGGGGTGGGAGAAGTSGQGYAGGTSPSDAAPAYAGAGGGGASAVGTNTTSTTGGNGGNGFYDSLTNAMGAATKTGELVSSNYYYAGGGAGGTDNPTGGGGTPGTAGYGGGGAAAVSRSFSASSGMANTGGGGGGNSNGSGTVGGNGGSGIIIIRYAV